MVGKYALIAMMFVVLFVTALFGQYFGYTVDGVPHGVKVSQEPETRMEIQLILGVPVLVEVEVPPDQKEDILTGALKYLWYFCSFKIDNVPYWMSGLFDLFIILTLVILFGMIRGDS